MCRKGEGANGGRCCRKPSQLGAAPLARESALGTVFYPSRLLTHSSGLDIVMCKCSPSV